MAAEELSQGDKKENISEGENGSDGSVVWFVSFWGWTQGAQILVRIFESDKAGICSLETIRLLRNP